MTYDVTTVKEFPISKEVSLRLLAQRQSLAFLSAQNSQNMLNVSQITFLFLFLESILELNKWFPPS